VRAFNQLGVQMSSVMRRCGRLAAFAPALLLSIPLFAQSTGTIQGTVSDPSNAPIPNASVTIKETNTGEERSLTTDSSGIFFAPSLPVGTYRVEAKAPGMSTVAAVGVVVPVGTTVRQDFSMKVAAASEVVEVQGNAVLLESETVSVGSVVNQTTVQEIPLN